MTSQHLLTSQYKIMSHAGKVGVGFVNSANVFSFCFLDKEVNEKFLEKNRFLDLSESIHCGIKTVTCTHSLEAFICT